MLLAMQNGMTRAIENMPGGMMEKGYRMAQDCNGLVGNGRHMMEKNMFFDQGGGVMYMIHAGFSILFGLALLAVVIIAAVWLYKLMKKHTCETSAAASAKVSETALEILSRRYAEGAISTEEYLERKQHLVE